MTPRRYYIGLAATFHDPALAIVSPEGEVLFAEATERFMQDKRAFNCPPDHLTRMPELIAEHCEPGSELCVALSWSEQIVQSYRSAVDARRALLQGPLAGAGGQPGSPRDRAGLFGAEGIQAALINSVSQAGSNIALTAPLRGHRVILRHYDHHLTHAATACYTSPYDEGLCAVVDGYGERGACDFFHYEHGRIRRIKPIAEPWETGSLGGFYGLLCILCGFDPTKGEEWKVMGLAAYGRHDARLHGLLASLYRVEGLGVHMNVPSYAAVLGALQHWQRRPDQPPLAAADLAHTGQIVFCELMTELLDNAYQQLPSTCLMLGGGCALNSACNGQLTARTKFRQLHVPCAPGDDGNALGAALLAYREDEPAGPIGRSARTPYLGSTMSRQRLGDVATHGQIPGLCFLGDERYGRVAELLAAGKIVGWIQGRAELGPRALGHRSILADPRDPRMKDEINARVKFREEFRPFAPSILHEHGDEYFEDYQESPYMERALPLRPAMRERVPAIVHVDGTGRLQSVKEEWSPAYHRLLVEFHRRTGVPLLLNTSFNVMGKPIAHAVEDAIALFYTTGLDALVIEDCLIEKRRA